MRRTDSGDSASSCKSSSSSRQSGRRPSSAYMGEGTADLNKLAREISGSYLASGSECGITGDSATESQVSRSTTKRSKTPTSRIPMIRRPNSPCDRGSTPSPTHKTVLNPTPSATTNAVVNARSYEQPTASSQARLAAKMAKQSSLEKDRPCSAQANHQSGHQQSEFYRPRSVTGVNRDDVELRSQKSKERRPSTPSSERTTPCQKPENTKQPLNGRSRASPTPGDTPRNTGLPPRTPYRVLARARASTLAGSGVGINELEGSVLLEADDYRRISNEVKALKTSLLKLKRELQGDVSQLKTCVTCA